MNLSDSNPAQGAVAFSLRKYKTYSSPFREAAITKIMRTFVWFALNKVSDTLTDLSMQTGHFSGSYFCFLFFLKFLIFSQN